AVPLAQALLYFWPFLVCESEPESIVLDALPPDLIQLGLRLRPRRVLTVELEFFIDSEVRRGLQLSQGKIQALPRAGPVNLEHIEHGIHRRRTHHVVEFMPVLPESIDIAF